MIGPAMACLVLLARATLEGQELPFGAASEQTMAGERSVVTVTVHPGREGIEAFDVLRYERSPVGDGWRASPAEARLLDPAGKTTIAGPAEVESLLVVRARDRTAYLIDGPFRWPSSAGARFVRGEWRRTVRGGFGTRGTPLVWSDESDRRQSPWPVCAWLETTWECVGVPLAAAGAVVSASAMPVSFAVVTAGAVTPGATGTAAWCRLLVVQRSAAIVKPAASRIVARRIHVPRTRGQPARLETETDDRIHLYTVAADQAWICGEEGGASGWLEVAAKGSATHRVESEDLLSGTSGVPLRVTLEPGGTISGLVRAADGTPAGRTLLALYRIEAAAEGSQGRVRRIAVRELAAGEEGAFAFEDLAHDRYEIVAHHPLAGRAVVALKADARDVEIRLRPPPLVVGRVMLDGRPAAGVPVVVLPDVGRFASGGDVTELRGGEGTTGRDGAFRVPAAARGSGEVRVGDARTGVRRLPLGPAESMPPVVDVGVLELGGVPPVTLVLEGAERCDVVLAGPAGRLGLAVVTAARIGPAMFEATVPEPGTWQVVAVCGTRERAVVPGVVELPAGGAPRTVRLTWP